jgi:hypothetical protein
VPKSLSQDDYKRTAKFISETVEPRIKKVIDEVNRFLAKQGIIIGAEIQWFFDGTEEQKEVGNGDKD